MIKIDKYLHGAKNTPPLEAAVKYLIRERDDYKARLEKLIPYAKELEKQLKNKDKEKILSEENERLKKELKAFKADYKETEWFKELKRYEARLKEKNHELEKMMNRILVENQQLKQEKDGQQIAK